MEWERQSKIMETNPIQTSPLPLLPPPILTPPSLKNLTLAAIGMWIVDEASENRGEMRRKIFTSDELPQGLARWFRRWLIGNSRERVRVLMNMGVYACM